MWAKNARSFEIHLLLLRKVCNLWDVKTDIRQTTTAGHLHHPGIIESQSNIEYR